MAGGKGTRLRPLTCNLPKPMLPLLNRPVMEYTIHLLKQHGIEEIAVTVQYMSSIIRSYFGDGSRWGVRLHYFEDSPPLGTAGSMKQAEDFLDEPFVVVSGDALTDFNLTKGIQFHQSGNHLVTIFLKEVAHPLQFGLAVINESNQIIKYIEKPSWREVVSNTVNTGIYVMDPDVFSYIEPNSCCDFSHDVFPHLLSLRQPVYGYLSDGYWLDIGTLPQYRQAHFDMLAKQVKTAIPYTEVLPSVWMGERVTIEEGTKIRGPALIGDGATIRAGAVIEPYTILGRNSTVSEGASIKKSILGNEVFVGRHCELAGTTISDGTIVEDSATLFEQSVIGEHCQIGKNAVIKARVKVWPGKYVDGYTVLSSSVAAEQEASAALFHQGCIQGKANVDITPEWMAGFGAAYGSAICVDDAVLIGNDGHAYTELLKQVFLNSLHAAGVHTIECPEVSDACFRYAIPQQKVQMGVFLYMRNEKEVVLRFYNEEGKPLAARTEKEIESIYLSETFRHVGVSRLGSSKRTDVDEDEYVRTVLRQLDVQQIRNAKLHLLVSKLSGPFQSAVLSFFQQLGCSLTWMHAAGNRDHMRLLLHSSRADLGIMFNEQGDSFELYDPDGNIYTSMDYEHIYIPEVLFGQPSSLSPLCFRQGTSYTIYYVEEPALADRKTPRDALCQIGKLLERTADKSVPFHALFSAAPQFHLLRDEVLCPWREKGKVMRRLITDVPPEQFELLDGIKLQHDQGEWSYIVCDASQPKLVIYSQSSHAAKARENIRTLTEKIRQYQKV